MPQALRAIYNQGQLLLLDVVKLIDGQIIQLFILSDEEILRAALGDLLLECESLDDGELDEAGLLKEIEADFLGKASVSKSIIEAYQEKQ